MIIRRLKEFQNMGMEELTISTPRVKAASLKEGGKGKAIRLQLQSLVCENPIIK